MDAIVAEARERAERAAAQGSSASALALLMGASTDVQSRDRSTAAVLLAEAVLYARMAYGAERALKLAQRAASMTIGASADQLLVIQVSLGNALQWNGRYEAAQREWRAATVITPSPLPYLLGKHAEARLRGGDLRGAMEAAYAASTRAEAAGDRGALRDSLTWRTLAEIHLGLLREAHGSALSLLAAAGPSVGNDRLEALGVLAWVEALLGDEQSVRQRIAEVGTNLGELHLTPSAGMAAGLLELALGRYELAVDQLETKLRGLTPVAALLSVRPFLDALVEACSRSERHARASQLVESVFEASMASRQPRYVAIAHRMKALVAESPADYEVALAHHDRWGNSFEEARTQLLYGEMLRRNKRKQEARDHLAAAAAGFGLSGAVLWERRARDELRAAGFKSPRPPNGLRLTAQEQRIALLVAEGLSNKEIAGRLVVSTKTVEGHLRNIFDKLGATSRTQVARMMPP